MKAQLTYDALHNTQPIKVGRKTYNCLEHPRYKGYWISSQGDVISLVSSYCGKPTQQRGTSKPVLRRAQVINSGYLRIAIALPSGGCKFELVHRLVAETFFVPPDYAPNLNDPFFSDKKPRIEVNHLNGNKRNNAVNNLEWSSHQENIHYEKILDEVKAFRQRNRSKKTLKNG